jgi:hypothetical protein
MRLVLWGVIVFAVVILLSHIKRITLQRASRDQADQRTSQQASVQCAQCGIHIPASEAIHVQSVQSGLAFCSEDHRLKHFSN